RLDRLGSVYAHQANRVLAIGRRTISYDQGIAIDDASDRVNSFIKAERRGERRVAVPGAKQNQKKQRSPNRGDREPTSAKAALCHMPPLASAANVQARPCGVSFTQTALV